MDSDLLLDCRFIPNPHWVPQLRPLNGLAKEVSEYVLNHEGVDDLLENYIALLRQMAEGYLREGKKYVTLAIGCTGGKHRSVAVAESIAAKLNLAHGAIAIDAQAIHRDVGRE